MGRVKVAGRAHVAPRRHPREARERGAGMSRRLWRIGLGLIAVSLLLAACAPDARQAAQSQKARLDKELQTARTSFGVPDGLLQPIETQEQTIASSAKSSDKSYSDAATRYTQLYNQVVAIEKMTPDQARAQTSADIQLLDTVIQELKNQDFALKATQYQAQLQQAQQQFAAAQTTKDYFEVDRFVEARLAAVAQIDPVYQQMKDLNALVDAQDAALGVVDHTPKPLLCAQESLEGGPPPYGVATPGSFWAQSATVTITPQGPVLKYEYQDWPAQNVALFRAADTAGEYSALGALLRAQIQQLTADAAALLPVRASRLVDAFQNEVQTYQQNGGTDTTYQQQLEQDKQALAATPTAEGYTALVQTVVQQRLAAALPFIKAQVQQDLKTLNQLIAQGQAIKAYDSYDGHYYGYAYEYADKYVGVGDATDRLAHAKSVKDYRLVDQELQMFITNIQALLTNLKDKTSYTKPHQTDLDLMKHYGITDTRVIVVSLREQAARMYDNGKLVKSVLVTTGDPHLPSVPGLHCTFGKPANYFDISPFPKTSPYYYKPTHINWGLNYSDYGYIIHDAWWRKTFGPGTNLPHYDPIAFNSGSHGCINMSTPNMDWVYHWSDFGTPALVY